jgi:hypothetical protein
MSSLNIFGLIKETGSASDSTRLNYPTNDQQKRRKSIQ